MRKILPATAALGICGILAAQNPSSPQPTKVLAGHTDPVYAVAVSPDGGVVATGSFDKSVRLWEAKTGKELRTLAGPKGHTNQVLCVAFSPDGRLLATGGSDNVVKVWSAAGAGVAAATGPALTAAGGWKLAPDSPAKSLAHPNLVDAVAFDKTGAVLATAGHDGQLRLWDVAKGQATKTIEAHTKPQPQPVYTVAWSPDCKKLATGCFDRTIKVWDATSGAMLKEIKGGTDVLPDPKAKTPPKREPGHIDQVFTLAFSPNGQFLASGSSDRTVKLWDATTGAHVRDFPNPTLPPAGPGLPPPSHPGFVHAVRFTADGARLVSAGTAPRQQGYLAVWNVADGKLLGGHELPLGPVYALDLTATELLLGCGPKDRANPDSDAVFLPLPK